MNPSASGAARSSRIRVRIDLGVGVAMGLLAGVGIDGTEQGLEDLERSCKLGNAKACTLYERQTGH